MSNIIQIKRKTTSGAPSAASLSVGEMCWVEPDEAMYIKKISGAVVNISSGGGTSLSDMIAGYFYDSVGGQTINTSATVVALDTAGVNVNNAFTFASNEVTITEAGYYLINYQVGGPLSSGTPSGLIANVEIDAGSGYAAASSDASSYGLIIGEDMGTAAGAFVVSLAVGDKVRLSAQGTTQSFTTDAGHSSLSLLLLKGAVGPEGPAGTNALAMTDGSGVPSSGLGVDGDYYLDDDTGNFYHKESGSWVLKANLKGPQGDVTGMGSMAYLDVWTGTQAAYDALGTYDADTIYLITA